MWDVGCGMWDVEFVKDGRSKAGVRGVRAFFGGERAIEADGGEIGASFFTTWKKICMTRDAAVVEGEYGMVWRERGKEE